MSEIKVPVNGGYIVAETSIDPDYPGIYLFFRSNTGYETSGVLMEAPVDKEGLYVRCWANLESEDPTIVFNQRWEDINRSLGIAPETPASKSPEQLFDELLETLNFSLIKYDDGWGIKDKEGANLGDIETERFMDAISIVDRLDSYIADSIVADLLAQTGLSDSDFGCWSDLVEMAREKGVPQSDTELLEFVCSYPKVDLERCRFTVAPGKNYFDNGSYLFEIVKKVPPRYKVWNIGRHMRSDKFLPLCEPRFLGTNSDEYVDINVETLKCIELPKDELELLRDKASFYGINDKASAQTEANVQRRGMTMEDLHRREIARKALEIFKRISM